MPCHLISEFFQFWLILFFYILYHFLMSLSHFELGYHFDLSLSFWYALIIHCDVFLLSIPFYLTITLQGTWLWYFSAALLMWNHFLEILEAWFGEAFLTSGSSLVCCLPRLSGSVLLFHFYLELFFPLPLWAYLIQFWLHSCGVSSVQGAFRKGEPCPGRELQAVERPVSALPPRAPFALSQPRGG